MKISQAGLLLLVGVVMAIVGATLIAGEYGPEPLAGGAVLVVGIGAGILGRGMMGRPPSPAQVRVD